MELLRAFVVLLGVSMFFSIITSVLTASEELRVNFPSGKYIGASEKGTADSPEDMHIEGQAKDGDLDARINLKDIKNGDSDSVIKKCDKSSISERTADAIEKKSEKEIIQHGNVNETSAVSD